MVPRDRAEPGRRLLGVRRGEDRHHVADDLDGRQDEAPGEPPPAEDGRAGDPADLGLDGTPAAAHLLSGPPSGEHERRPDPVGVVDVNRSGPPADRAWSGMDLAGGVCDPATRVGAAPRASAPCRGMSRRRNCGRRVGCRRIRSSCRNWRRSPCHLPRGWMAGPSSRARGPVPDPRSSSHGPVRCVDTPIGYPIAGWMASTIGSCPP